MTRANMLAHRFVDYIPESLDEATLYISVRFATAVHACCCGCGVEIATPLSPTDWRITFDGETVSLYPSIGNWSLPCRSHYWIERNRVRWARAMSRGQIESEQAADRTAKDNYYGRKPAPDPLTVSPANTRWWPRFIRALRVRLH